MEGSDSLFLRRRWDGVTENYDLTQMRDVWGFDINSYVEHNTDAESIFVDPSNNDYRILSGHACEGFGASEDVLGFVSVIPFPVVLPGDLNLDGVVNFDDLNFVSSLSELLLVGRNFGSSV